MLAPLRRGKKETLGRANGVTRTGRSLLFGLVLVVLVTASSILYTSERLVVESMLKENLSRENTLELVQKRTEKLACDVAALASIRRIRQEIARDSSMVALDWKDVVVVEHAGGASR
jgi:hypothetical protein